MGTRGFRDPRPPELGNHKFVLKPQTQQLGGQGEGMHDCFNLSQETGVVKGLRRSCNKAAGEGKADQPATFSPLRSLLLSLTNADLILALPS